MALENKKSLVQFGYGYNDATSKQAGMLSFDASAQAIYVGDGNKANLVTSSVKDATYADNILTITKINGDTHTLNFKDVASASGTMAAFNELKTNIKNINDSIDALDASYKATDKAINDKIGGEFDSTNTVAVAIAEAKSIADAARTEDEVNTQIDAKISALGGGGDDVDDSSFVKVAVTSSNGEVTSVTVTTTNIASAAILEQVKGRVDTFLDTNGVENTVDTLKDIQAWINGDGVDATELTSAIAAEAKLREDADSSLSNRIKAVEDDYLKNADKTTLQGNIDAVSAVANAAAVKTTTDASLALKADASSVYAKSETYTKTEVDGLVSTANSNASTAETNAKTYADAIKVNGQTQSNQEITVSGVNILVGGTGTHNTASVSAAIEDLYTEVGKAIDAAGVTSVSVDTNSSNYASVDKSTGTVSLTIKKVTLADATTTKTGVADAYDVKTSIATAKSEAISAVQGAEGDASTAATVAGAKAYADAQIEANALKWNIL